MWYGGLSNMPWKKFSFPLPSGCVELPTTIRAARSTRGAEIEAGCVAATPATVVATPTAATPIATLRARFLAALLIPDALLLGTRSNLSCRVGVRRAFAVQDAVISPKVDARREVGRRRHGQKPGVGPV